MPTFQHRPPLRQRVPSDTTPDQSEEEPMYEEVVSEVGDHRPIPPESREGESSPTRRDPNGDWKFKPYPNVRGKSYDDLQSHTDKVLWAI